MIRMAKLALLDGRNLLELAHAAQVCFLTGNRLETFQPPLVIAFKTSSYEEGRMEQGFVTMH